LTSVNVTVVYFAQAREFAERAEEEFVLTSPAHVEQLLSAVMKTHPKLSRIRQIIRTMVNGRPVVESDELKDGDRVALLPPVAGG